MLQLVGEVVVVLVTSLILFLYIYKCKDIKYLNIIFLGYILRLVVLFLDYFDLAPIMHSGIDSDNFHNFAMNNLTTFRDVHLTNYTVFLTAFYELTFGSRFLAQYVNIIVSIFSILYIQRTLLLLDVNKKYIYGVTLLLAFLPNVIILSSVLLRESLISFFVSISIYYFTKWYMKQNMKLFLLALVFVGLSISLHSGMFPIALIYGYAFVFLNIRSGRITLSVKKLILLGVISIPIVMYISANFQSIFYKFLENSGELAVEGLMGQTNDAGSAYLQWVNIDNIFTFVLFSPIKAIYLLFSPLPTEWRGIKDIFAFAIDGAFYLFLVLSIYKSSRYCVKFRYIKVVLLMMLVSLSLLFGVGTYNAGTAIRHRSKLLPIIVVCYALVSTSKLNNKYITVYGEEDRKESRSKN